LPAVADEHFGKAAAPARRHDLAAAATLRGPHAHGNARMLPGSIDRASGQPDTAIRERGRIGQASLSSFGAGLDMEDWS
jgi:hypothetical protein